MQKFFVSGMFRSGTTLIARVLNSNEHITCASDPFAPLFKSFRNAILSDEDVEFDPRSPLDDYYFSRKKLSHLHLVKNATLQTKCSINDLVQLRKDIVVAAKPYSPKIIDHINNLRGSNYFELFESAYDILRDSYGTNESKIYGFKEVWTNEFAHVLADELKDTKVIHVVRDPRSVFLSNLSSNTGAYPPIFLCRQWRKIS